MMKISAYLLFVPLLGMSCIVPAPSTEQTVAVANNEVGRPRTDRVGANFGDKVELVSVTLDPATLTPANPVRVTLVFKVLADLDKNYQVFIHVEDADRRAGRMTLDHDPSSKPTSEWKAGETVTDTFVIKYDPAGAPRLAYILGGLWDPIGGARLPLTNRTTVRNDGADRVYFAALPVSSQ